MSFSIQLVWDRLSAENKKFILDEGKQVSFICIGGVRVGKSTVIQQLALEKQEQDNERVRWSKKIAAEGVEFNFYEYSSPPSSSSLSIPKGPRCVILFTQFLKEITGDFKQEMRDAKRISEELNCQTLVIYTFCDATAFPHSFVSQVKSSLSSSNSIKVNRTVISSAWRETKDNNIGDIFGKNVSTADFQFSAYDPSPQMEDVLDKLTLVMSSFAGLSASIPITTPIKTHERNKRVYNKLWLIPTVAILITTCVLVYKRAPFIQFPIVRIPFTLDGIRKYLFNIARGVCSKLVGTR